MFDHLVVKVAENNFYNYILVKSLINQGGTVHLIYTNKNIVEKNFLRDALKYLKTSIQIIELNFIDQTSFSKFILRFYDSFGKVGFINNEDSVVNYESFGPLSKISIVNHTEIKINDTITNLHLADISLTEILSLQKLSIYCKESPFTPFNNSLYKLIEKAGYKPYANLFGTVQSYHPNKFLDLDIAFTANVGLYAIVVGNENLSIEEAELKLFKARHRAKELAGNNAVTVFVTESDELQDAILNTKFSYDMTDVIVVLGKAEFIIVLEHIENSKKFLTLWLQKHQEKSIIEF